MFLNRTTISLQSRLLYSLISLSALLVGCVAPATQTLPAASEFPIQTEQPKLTLAPVSGTPSIAYPEPTSEPGGTLPAYPGIEETASHPYAPQPEDSALNKSAAFVDQSQLLTLESFPPQFRLVLKGSVPTPCNQLRIQINAPDEQNRILVIVYSVLDPKMICIQVLDEFDVSVPIPTPPQGPSYQVWVNEGQVGEIQW